MRTRGGSLRYCDIAEAHVHSKHPLNARSAKCGCFFAKGVSQHSTEDKKGLLRSLRPRQRLAGLAGGGEVVRFIGNRGRCWSPRIRRNRVVPHDPCQIRRILAESSPDFAMVRAGTLWVWSRAWCPGHSAGLKNAQSAPRVWWISADIKSSTSPP